MSAAVTITGISAVTWEGREHNSTTSFDTEPEHEQYEDEHLVITLEFLES